MGNPSGIISRNLPIRIAMQRITEAGTAPLKRHGGLYPILTKTGKMRRLSLAGVLLFAFCVVEVA
jgi:hypothetical protein